MKLAIITHVVHIKERNQYFGYAPYIREMNLWLKYVDEVVIVAPLDKKQSTAIDSFYTHQKIDFRNIPNFCFTSVKNNLKSLFKLPLILWQIFRAMKQVDHIHLRCPGNMGLLGCFVQILFPNKTKTAKYAGNWDPKSKQPWSYRLQKWILSSTFLTRNMQVLVYGEWEGSSKNIKSFFTATYSETEKVLSKPLDLKGKIHFVFVGTLSKGKNPTYTIQLIERLIKKGYKVTLDLYGEGTERTFLEDYIRFNALEGSVVLHGNQNQATVKAAYQNCHFVLLPSKSEGWPKAIAEGMFWGCVPLATPVSCVPFMLDYGKQGLLLTMDLGYDIQQLEVLLSSEVDFYSKREKVVDWSQKYTIDVFENEIKKLILK